MSHDIASEGLCTITAVTFYPHDGAHGRCVGELRTDCAETFGIFDDHVLEAAEEARSARSRVLLDVRRSRAGHRYVQHITPLDTSVNPTPCLRCATLAPKVAASPAVPEHYACPSCAALWFLQPITRAQRHEITIKAPR